MLRTHDIDTVVECMTQKYTYIVHLISSKNNGLYMYNTIGLVL